MFHFNASLSKLTVVLSKLTLLTAVCMQEHITHCPHLYRKWDSVRNNNQHSEVSISNIHFLQNANSHEKIYPARLKTNYFQTVK